MVASNDTADASGIYRPTADASGRPMPVYEGLSNGLESEISLLFGDAMTVRCEPLSYARRCIALVRSHDTADREAIREALKNIGALLRPFDAAVFNDNGDVTISTGHIDTRTWLGLIKACRELTAALALIREG
jgi:hypothetical protein